MKHEVVVPDASVILKWAFQSAPDEQDVSQAHLLLEGWLAGEYQIALPGLWAFEVANVLGMKVPDMAAELMEAFIDYRFRSVEMTHPLCSTALGIMRQCGVTFYDAAYHAVALQKKGLMVTADDAYFRKAKRLGHIALLRDYR